MTSYPFLSVCYLIQDSNFVLIVGFKSLQKACCGIGGKYNVGFGKLCGDPGVPVCPNPNNHLNWDGVHPTQQTNMFLATWLISNMLPKLDCY